MVQRRSPARWRVAEQARHAVGGVGGGEAGGLGAVVPPLDDGAAVEDRGLHTRGHGGRLLPSVDYVIPGANVRHRVVLVEKCTPTPNGYPRRWAKIQKAPL